MALIFFLLRYETKMVCLYSGGISRAVPWMNIFYFSRLAVVYRPWVNEKGAQRVPLFWWVSRHFRRNPTKR
jgi:hypothetical protein